MRRADTGEVDRGVHAVISPQKNGGEPLSATVYVVNLQVPGGAPVLITRRVYGL